MVKEIDNNPNKSHSKRKEGEKKQNFNSTTFKYRNKS